MSKRKLKIVILSHSSELGGAERSMLDLFDRWTDNGKVEAVFIIKKSAGSLAAELEKRGWAYEALEYGAWAGRKTPQRTPADEFRYFLVNARATQTIEKLIDKHKPDLVMTNTMVSPWAAMAAYFKSKPHVWFVREYGMVDTGQSYFFETSRESVFSDIELLSDLVVANSQTLASYLAEYIKKDKIATLYTPFDLDALEAQMAKRSPTPYKRPTSLKLMITGRIAPLKGQADIAEALGILTKEGFDIELCVIGAPADPEDAEPLKAVIEKYGISDSVHLVGQKSAPVSYLPHADVGITASKSEAFGRATFEYMAAGLPVIGAESGATPELVEEGHSGLLYEPGNVKALASQLKKYAADPGLARKHGQQGRKKARAMMAGASGSEALFEKIKKVAAGQIGPNRHSIHLIRRWMDYPGVAEQYIDHARNMSLRRVVKIALRSQAKKAYIYLQSFIINRQK